MLDFPDREVQSTFTSRLIKTYAGAGLEDELLAQMDQFEKEFHELRDLLAAGDAEGMKEKMRLSTQRRAYFDK